MNASFVPQPVAIAPHRIHPETRPGMVHLRVASLERQVRFYQQVLRLKLHWREGTSAGLGAGGADLVRLSEIPHGRRYRGVSGLYHFAILFPDRRELARAIARLMELRWPNAPTDHIMTKTTYLDDPEGNTIELYCESAEDGFFGVEGEEFVARRADGSLSDGREPLDLRALFAHLPETEPLDLPIPSEARIGHFHLYVASLEETLHFYHGLLGFDHMGLMRSFRMGMVSAGGYHHHIGFNTWQGEGVPPPPTDALGLKYFSFVLPSADEMARLTAHLQHVGVPFQQRDGELVLHDPSRNELVFTLGEVR